MKTCIFLLVALGYLVINNFKNVGESFNKPYNSSNCPILKANDNVWEQNDAQKFNNCYAYAFEDLDTNRKFKPQPGLKSNKKHIKASVYSCKKFIENIISDYPGSTFHKTLPECRNCRRRIFLALDNTGPKKDYHFWRENSDGFWTHKPGSGPVLHTDGDGKKITNPLYSNRNFGNYNYNLACGFFCID